jgi:bifunctional DNA-binding transcriptional regulator/antitoxin component of YhaV-PrlF toxin-antitoxin module
VKPLYLGLGKYLAGMVELEKTEASVKKVDRQGRICIPIEWRREWKSNRVVLVKREKGIEITPMDIIPPSSLFDSIEIPDDVDFTDPHSVKKAFLELKEQ